MPGGCNDCLRPSREFGGGTDAVDNIAVAVALNEVVEVGLIFGLKQFACADGSREGWMKQQLQLTDDAATVCGCAAVAKANRMAIDDATAALLA